ncbi:lysozyme inhibitor LprI family protein [Thalassobacillus sp. CUG 92003]|uniref:lysozyme inhibitor LprI family protein n=1 Tax=Thalassobacillus sp. CUG 92003 TaxID=2736641 RepID=UPI0015E776B2|nr:lysozyme inhibitor LprI family protein [Thalassobacillus sp. CUG 92003]
MQNNRIIMGTVVCVMLLAACEQAPDASTSDDSTHVESKENGSNTEHTDTDTNENDTSEKNNVPLKDEDSSSEAGLKEAYQTKLVDSKQETERLEAADSSTYALKKVENDRWDIWDELLNDIYGVLKERLSPEEMEQLREKQRNWIEFRDDRALEASQKYEGGTQEHLEYVAVLANLTEERCYELVEDYMK